MDDKAFLEKLKDMARKYGSTGLSEQFEVNEFVKWCYQELGEPEPSDADLEATKE